MWRSPKNFLALLVCGMAFWLEQTAAAEIEYRKAENRALRVRLGRRRLLFTDAERTLAILAKKIGRTALKNIDPIVSPSHSAALALGIGSQ
jgi:hypothetical protein